MWGKVLSDTLIGAAFLLTGMSLAVLLSRRNQR